MNLLGVEAAKWVALALMFGDHVNRAVLGGEQPWLSDLARIVMPTFALVLGAQLAGAEPDAARRTLRRLLLVAIVSQPLFAALLAERWYTLNILFGLAAGVAVLAARTRRQSVRAWLLVFLAGFFVEYLWFAPLLVVLSARACVVQEWQRYVVALVAVLLALCVVQETLWPMGVCALIPLCMMLAPDVPRVRRLFYVAYPAHLAVVGVVAFVAQRGVGA